MQPAALHPHPSTPCPAVRSFAVTVVRDRDLHLTYELRGDLDAIALPAPASGFADELWRHTCFEAFIAPDPGTAYRELNCSPSGQWAMYAFASYRQRVDLDPLPPAPKTDWQRAADRLTLTAVVPLAADGATLRLGIAAVIETRAGALSYWALTHPAARPDFHAADGFTLRLPAC